MNIPAAVERCREEGARGVSVYAPRFIQLRVDEATHLNFWGLPAEPTRTIQSGVHTHYVDFASRILLGEFTNVRYAAVDDPDGPLKRYYLARSRHGANDQWEYRIAGGQERVRIVAEQVERYIAGHCYSMTASELHATTVTGPAITLMTKNLDTAGTTESFLTDIANTLYADEMVPKSRSPKDATELAECWARVDSFLQLL